MKQKNKELVNDISRALKFSAIDMITSNSNEEEAGELLDVIFSSHVTSMLSCMRLIAEMCDEGNQKNMVLAFIENLEDFFKQCAPLEKVEIYNM